MTIELGQWYQCDSDEEVHACVLRVNKSVVLVELFVNEERLSRPAPINKEEFIRDYTLCKRPLFSMSYEEYKELLDSGMLWELYPNAKGSYSKDVKGLPEDSIPSKVEPIVTEDVKGDSSAWDSQVGGHHYKDMGVEPLELTYKNKGYKGFEGAAYCKVNKYIGREKVDLLEDLDKAIHVIEIWKEVLKEEMGK